MPSFEDINATSLATSKTDGKFSDMSHFKIVQFYIKKPFDYVLMQINLA